jgi:hypothetical protein
LTTKIVALVDALGNLARFVLLPGQRHDSIAAEPLITGVDFGALIADEAFVNDALRAILNERGATADRGGKPLPLFPPKRTCGSPAYSSPVDGFLIGGVSRGRRLR